VVRESTAKRRSLMSDDQGEGAVHDLDHGARAADASCVCR
jgi:hypothetical protein